MNGNKYIMFSMKYFSCHILSLNFPVNPKIPTHHLLLLKELKMNTKSMKSSIWGRVEEERCSIKWNGKDTDLMNGRGNPKITSNMQKSLWKSFTNRIPQNPNHVIFGIEKLKSPWIFSHRNCSVPYLSHLRNQYLGTNLLKTWSIALHQSEFMP